jgi:ubiquinone biosynthesis monooxygenase Coq7
MSRAATEMIDRPPIDRGVHDIIKVDHAGEFGAIGIYQAQRLVARWRTPNLVPMLTDLLEYERAHYALFDNHVRQRGVRRCRVFPLWRAGGWVLGATTAVFGRSAIAACTEAVESVVVAHLRQQIGYLRDTEPELAADIASILAEEEGHRDIARNYRIGWFGRRIIAPVVRVSTETCICLSMRL